MSALAGCDTEKRIGLDELVLQGPVTVKLVLKVERLQADQCYLEVYDSAGKLRARHSALNCGEGKLPWETRMVHDDGRVYKKVAADEVGFVKEK